MDKPSLCIFGEVLYDCFPDGRKVLGGAPFNVAWHLQAFGAAPRLVSAVGDDADGEHIRAGMADWGMLTSHLQTDPNHPTGKVQVHLEDGEPSYDIVADSAYDFIRTPDEADTTYALVYHGTLALRQPVSAATLAGIKASEPDLVFLDVNLRAPWWSRDKTVALVTDADWVKLNAHELSLLSGADAATAKPIPELARDFLEHHDLLGLIVTLGSKGALGLMKGSEPVHIAPPPALQVVDTVGAGDAFAAVTILGIVNGWSLDKTLERAQSFASSIVGQRGATEANPKLYAPLVDQWGLID
ncbi:PfkB family carbohydrate kinase [Thiocystis violacea]|uniref:PfkB family carbohydrate kinase n=1 Tax=Thiocystis violacea TaxID=13725 RepID=UPI00190344F3|nr:carbohydrate kinase [Thiocystis violacea]